MSGAFPRKPREIAPLVACQQSRYVNFCSAFAQKRSTPWNLGPNLETNLDLGQQKATTAIQKQESPSTLTGSGNILNTNYCVENAFGTLQRQASRKSALFWRLRAAFWTKLQQTTTWTKWRRLHQQRQSKLGHLGLLIGLLCSTGRRCQTSCVHPI